VETATRVMMAEMGTLMADFEPAIRDGLARAYAKRFTPKQLGELNRFFATPTGKAYAADSMVIFMDPEVMTAMTQAMPVMTKQMPAIMSKVEAATADMPPARKPEELNPEERSRLAELLGVPEDQIGADNFTLFEIE
jgi:hypothetical protein